MSDYIEETDGVPSENVAGDSTEQKPARSPRGRKPTNTTERSIFDLPRPLERCWRMKKMTKAQFLQTMKTALEERCLPDAAEILEEYEQHFAFKLADG